VPVPSVSAEALVRALKSHPLPEVGGYPFSNLFEVRPGQPVVKEGDADAGGGGTIYVSSQLISGGEGVVSKLQTWLDDQPFLSLSFFASSGVDRWYLTDLAFYLGFDESRALRLSEAVEMKADVPVPLDVPLFTWRGQSPDGPVAVSVEPRSVRGLPDAFAACWVVEVAPIRQRLCTVHGAPVSLEVRYQGTGGERILTVDPANAPTWNPTPPAGVPAPPLAEGAIRTIDGDRVGRALQRPAFADYAEIGSTTLPLGSPDRTGSVATLRTETMRAPVPTPSQSYTAILGSTIDGMRSARVTATIENLRWGSDLARVSLQLDDRAVVLDGPRLRMGGARFAMDRTLGTWEGGGARVRLKLLSVAGMPEAYQVCWEVLADTLARTQCSVHGVEGLTGTVTDVVDGVAVRYR